MNNPHQHLTTAITKWKITLLYCIVSFFLFFEMAVQVSPSVMSTELMHDLDIGAFGLGIMSGVYFYTYTAMQIPSGILFDKFNPRIIITFSILTCALGTLLFALATNIYVGSLARLLMGSGSAFAFVSVLVVTADLFKPNYFATMTGITQMLAAFGAMAGQMPIRALITEIGWRHTLFVLTAIGILLSIVVWTLLKYEKRSFKQTSAPASIKENLKRIISERQTWYVAFYSCLLWAPMSSFGSLWGVPFLTDVHQLSETTAAFLCSLMWLGLALGSPVLGIISTAMNNRIIPLAISALIGSVAFGLLLEFNFTTMWIGVLLFLAGAACSGQALAFTLVKENNDNSVKATAIAFNNMAVVISGALFQPIIGKIIQSPAGSISLYNENTFKQGLSIVLGAYIISFIIATFFLKKIGSKVYLTHMKKTTACTH